MEPVDIYVQVLDEMVKNSQIMDYIIYWELSTELSFFLAVKYPDIFE